MSMICFHWHGLEESWKLAPSQRTTSLGSLSYLVAFPRNDGTEFSVALVAISKFTLYYSAFCNFSACHKLNQLIDNNLSSIKTKEFQTDTILAPHWLDKPRFVHVFLVSHLKFGAFS